MNHKEYFDGLAYQWDEITKHDEQKLIEIVDLFNLYRGAKVLDVGSGTGVLIPFIISKIESSGKLVCLDISEKMLSIAAVKFPRNSYPNIDFTCMDILNYETDERFNFIICYSSFPHFINKERSIKRMSSLLLKWGKLIIAHSQSRKEINSFHKKRGEPVSKDYLPSMKELTSIFEEFSLKPILSVDSDGKFVIIGERVN